MINADDIARAYNRYYKIQDELWQVAADLRNGYETVLFGSKTHGTPEDVNERLFKANRAVERLKQLEKMKHGNENQ